MCAVWLVRFAFLRGYRARPRDCNRRHANGNAHPFNLPPGRGILWDDQGDNVLMEHVMRRMPRLFDAVVCVLLSFAGWGPRASADSDDPFRPPAITTHQVPAVPAELMERLRQYQNTRSAAFRGWSPDGKGILIATRFGDTTQLHRVYDSGGRREQIT